MELTAEVVFYVIVLCVAGFMAVLGNGVLVCLLATTKDSLKSLSNYYMMSMSIADTLVGLFVTSSVITTVLDVSLPSGWCYISPYFELVALSAEIFSFILISYDRYLAIAKALLYHPTKKSVVLSLAIVWVSAIIYSVRVFLQYEVTKLMKKDSQDHNDLDDVANATIDTDGGTQTRNDFCNLLNEEDYSDLIFRCVDFIVLFVAPIVCMVYWYRCIIQKLWAANTTNAHSVNRKKRIIKMLIVNVAVFFVCWIPFYLSDMIEDSITLAKTLQGDQYDDDDDDGNANNYRLFLIFLAVSHSYLNPIIYFTFRTDFREELKNKICKGCSRQHVVKPAETTRETYISRSS